MTKDPRESARTDGVEDSSSQEQPVDETTAPAETIATRAVFDRSITSSIPLPDLSRLGSELDTAEEAAPTEAPEVAKAGSGFPLKTVMLIMLAIVPVAIMAFAFVGLRGDSDEVSTASNANAGETPTELTDADDPDPMRSDAPTALASATDSTPEVVAQDNPEIVESEQTTTSTVEPEQTTTSTVEPEQTTSSVVETGSPFNCQENQGPTTPQLVVANIPADDPDGGLNIREGASVSATKLITSPNGTAFVHLGGCETLPNGDVWWEVAGEGIVGWANAKYFTE